MKLILLLIFCLSISGCGTTSNRNSIRIEFTNIPQSSEGGSDNIEMIAGRIEGAKSGQKIVLYAKSGVWWIQPFLNDPFTEIQSDGTWQNSTHLGTEYGALLVEADYKPPAKVDSLPSIGDGVLAIATVKGSENPHSTPKIIKFSGYDWKVRQTASDRGGMVNEYSAENAWVDEKGFLHLRITRGAQDKWQCAEISLTRSLGYGTYSLSLQDTSKLEPAAVFSLFTWDDLEAGQNHREMNIEMTRWGDPANKNLRYVIQPFYVPTNVVQFNAPTGNLTHLLNWTNGKAEFKTIGGFETGNKAKTVSQYTFSSGVPTSGDETVHLSFYVFGYSKQPMEKDSEIVVEKFEFLP